MIEQKNAEFERFRKERAEYETKYKEAARELETLKKSIIRAKGEMKELRNTIDLEVPTLQMKLDEITELEAELKELEEQHQVRNSRIYLFST